MDFAIECEQIHTMTIHAVVTRGEFDEEFLQEARIAFAQTMQLAKMAARIGLNVIPLDRFINQRLRFREGERWNLFFLKAIALLPQMPDRIRLRRSTRNPDRNGIGDTSDVARDSRRRDSDMIERHGLASARKVSQEAILSLDDVEFAMRQA